MKQHFSLSIILLSFFLIVSCKKEAKGETIIFRQKNYSQLEKANWFLGRWKNNSPEGNLSESWKKINDSTFFGESYFVIKKDTVFVETIQLEERNSKLSYIVTVPNQNDEKPVSFELTRSNTAQMVFENPNHDFPDKIIYNQVGNDSLLAEISGMKDGKIKKEVFRMKKKK